MAEKKLHLLDRFIYFLNVIFALLLLLSYALPFISPKYIPFISILNFGIPVLLLINFLFLLYWLFKLKKQVILSTLILLLGYSHITSLYIFSEKKNENLNGYKLMSYNVRHFNSYQWIKNLDAAKKIKLFIENENPDIIAFQDYHAYMNFDIKNTYPYHFVIFNKGKETLSTAFFSKYPIINKQKIQFQNSTNCAIFVDIALKNDTIRVFNLHLESLKINPDVKSLKDKNTKQLAGRIGQAFKKQAEQTELIQPFIEKSPYKNIVIGDFNNTAFSYVYRELKKNGLKDAFKEKGNGFGRTYDIKYIPIRIDHALVDEAFEVLDFKNYKVKYSDHYPILVEFELTQTE